MIGLRFSNKYCLTSKKELINVYSTFMHYAICINADNLMTDAIACIMHNRYTRADR